MVSHEDDLTGKLRQRKTTSHEDEDDLTEEDKLAQLILLAKLDLSLAQLSPSSFFYFPGVGCGVYVVGWLRSLCGPLRSLCVG